SDILDFSATTLNNIDHIETGNGNDSVTGSSGNDVIIGGLGSDTIKGEAGRDFVIGDDGNDVISGGMSADILVGGAGNDTVNLEGSNDTILFSAGDGYDTVNLGDSSAFNISVGGGIRLSDLNLSRNGDDLLLDVVDSTTGTTTETIELNNWYSPDPLYIAPQVTLQIIMEASDEFDVASAKMLYQNKIERLNFNSLVDSFDASNANQWAVMNSALDAHLEGSDSDALGGDIAYRYGLSGSASVQSVVSASSVLQDPEMGIKPQILGLN
ncbi:MAG: hypothetical protein OQK13_01530, partial [Gammaproteobacteria bacterium]|nr:hypothetical protein [Gammaproteobacteria bacterium]